MAETSAVSTCKYLLRFRGKSGPEFRKYLGDQGRWVRRDIFSVVCGTKERKSEGGATYGRFFFGGRGNRTGVRWHARGWVWDRSGFRTARGNCHRDRADRRG